MAKSLRSKWKRKMRNVKRQRYGEKELTRLKKTLSTNKDVEMLDPQLVTVTDAKKVKEDAAKKQESMEVDQQKASNYDPLTLKDEHGHYPVWVAKKKLRRIIRKNKQRKKKKR